MSASWLRLPASYPRRHNCYTAIHETGEAVLDNYV
jgi:hypothetical protein